MSKQKTGNQKTIYLNSEVEKILLQKAKEQKRSLSFVINEILIEKLIPDSLN
jgi:predicted CopG family antitoxin